MKQAKKKNQGFWAAACARKNKPAYMGKIMRTQFLPKNPKNTKNSAEPLNGNPNNLTCILNIQKCKPRLEKHIKTCYNQKKKKTNRRIKSKK